MTDYALPLKGKLALVTGASRGLGAAIAMELARRGADLVLLYSSPSSESKTSTIASQIRALPHAPQAHIIQADLSRVDAADKVVSGLHQTAFKEDSRSAEAGAAKRLHILVNNAGTERDRPLGEITLDDYDAVYNINVRAVVLLTQALLPFLCPSVSSSSSSSSTSSSKQIPDPDPVAAEPGRDTGSRIINLSSVGSRYGFPRLSLYCSSKAALEGLTRSWAAELGGDGTTVNCVNPGPVASDMLDKIPKEIVERQMRETPVGRRLGTADEVADVVAALAGREGRWVSGQCVNVSGGWSMY